MKPVHTGCFEDFAKESQYGAIDGKLFRIIEEPSTQAIEKYKKSMASLAKNQRNLTERFNRARKEEDYLAYVYRGFILFGFEFGMFFIKAINSLVPRFLNFALRGYDQTWREFESRLPGGWG
jgi:hypothetical protein